MKNSKKKNIFSITALFVIVSLFPLFTFAENCPLPLDFVKLPAIRGIESSSGGYGRYYYGKNTPVAASWGLTNNASNKWNLSVPNRDTTHYVCGDLRSAKNRNDWFSSSSLTFPTSIETDPKDSQLHVTVSTKSALQACTYDTNAGAVTATLKNNPQIDTNDPQFLKHFHVITSISEETRYQCDTTASLAEECAWKNK